MTASSQLKQMTGKAMHTAEEAAKKLRNNHAEIPETPDTGCPQCTEAMDTDILVEVAADLDDITSALRQAASEAEQALNEARKMLSTR